MFGTTVVTQLGFDATSGLATSIVSSKKETLVGGVLAGVTSKLSKDTVVTGIGRTIADAGLVYGAMLATRQKLKGASPFSLNPLAPI